MSPNIARPGAADIAMRVGVIGADRWAATGLSAALERGPAPPRLHAQPLEPDEPMPEGDQAPDVVVVVGVPIGGARAVLDRLPALQPVLWLGLAPPDAAQSAARGRRPFGSLPAQADDARLRAAIVALALGLSVFDAATGAPSAPRAVEADHHELREALTPREVEVFEWLAKGLGNREIAAVLGISAHTAKFHVAQILEKTGSATRTEAVRQGLRLGLVGL